MRLEEIYFWNKKEWTREELFQYRKSNRDKFLTEEELKRNPTFQDFLDHETLYGGRLKEVYDDVSFALGLGFKIIFADQGQKVPLKGIKWGSKTHVFPPEYVIREHVRKFRHNIGCETARSNVVVMDYDRAFKRSDLIWPFIDSTLRNHTPGSRGNHLFFWNDVFRLRLGHQKKNDKPWPVGHSKWLKVWRNENPGLLDALFSECDIVRIRNEIAWIPPSETLSGRYRWAEPRRPPMLFSELLISLSKGRRNHA